MVRTTAHSHGLSRPKAGGELMGESQTRTVPLGSGCFHQTLALVFLGCRALGGQGACTKPLHLVIAYSGTGCLHQSLVVWLLFVFLSVAVLVQFCLSMQCTSQRAWCCPTVFLSPWVAVGAANFRSCRTCELLHSAPIREYEHLHF